MAVVTGLKAVSFVTAFALLSSSAFLPCGSAVETSTILRAGPKEKLCAACTQAVLQIQLFLSDPSLLNSTVALMEAAVCKQLTPEEEQQCDAAVEQYIPAILGQLQEDITVEGVCIEKLKICPAPDLKAGELQGAEECYACRLVVKLLKKNLSKPTNQAKIKAFLESKCSIVANATTRAECTDAIDKFLPVVFANLDIILEDKKICKGAGLCASLGSVASA